MRAKSAIDATDTLRGIISAREQIPVVRPGGLTLLYPKWMPGYHSPQNPLELFAGLEIKAGDTLLPWRRDPVEVYAFHLEVPEGVRTLDATFQFLSPTNSAQGDVVVTRDMINLQWGRVLLYPAGYFSRQIRVEASLKLPEGWRYATALARQSGEGQLVMFEPAQLDVLVDSPVMAGRVVREIPLDADGAVLMALFAHDPTQLEAAETHVEAHRALVAQTDRLFASRHYDRYRFLVALSDELGGGGASAIGGDHRAAGLLHGVGARLHEA